MPFSRLGLEGISSEQQGAVLAGARRVTRHISQRLQTALPDARTRHLAASIDHADLERRLREYDSPGYVIVTCWPSL